MMNKPPSSDIPVGFQFPAPYLKVLERDLVDLSPWHIIHGENLSLRLTGLQKRYPDRVLIPFAERYDRDDVACFIPGERDRVYIIHDFASPGYEDRAVYDDFWQWFRAAVDEMIEHD